MSLRESIRRHLIQVTVSAQLLLLLFVIYQDRLEIVHRSSLQTWTRIYQQLQLQQNKHLNPTTDEMTESNQRTVNWVRETPNYCETSDALKTLHPDILNDDIFFWIKDKEWLRKSIMEGTGYLSLQNMKKQLPYQTSYILGRFLSIWRTFKFGKNLGCTYQKFWPIPGSMKISDKTYLVDSFLNFNDKLRKKSISNVCLNNSALLPTTYRLWDKRDCQSFFTILNNKKHQQMYEKHGPQYIMKSDEHQGQGVKMMFTDQIEEVRKKYQNGSACGNIKKEVLVQKYVTNPFLLKGHKLEFRIYHLIASTSPLIVYSNRRPLIRRCSQPHVFNSTDKSSYVCNSAVVIKNEGLTRHHELNKEEEKQEYFIDWGFERIQDMLLEEGKIQSDDWLETYLYPAINRGLIHLIRSTQHTYLRDSRYFLTLHQNRFSGWFGTDMILDDELNVWILEINTTPGIQGPTEDRVKRYYKWIADVFEINFAYLRSKYSRLVKYLQRHIYRRMQVDPAYRFWHIHDKKLKQLQIDKLEAEYEISKDNLFVKIIDESVKGKERYSDLLPDQCVE